MLMSKASECMARLNRTGARAMRAASAHAATDVTGFGLLGHARNLAHAQRERVRLVIDTLVVLEHTPLIAADAPYFKLLEGFSAETSGGLLVAVAKENVEAFRKECDGPVW